MQRDSRNRRAAAAAGMGITHRLVQVACTVILMPVLLHTLGIVRFGVWGAAASLAWLVGLVDIGAGSALVTLVARSMALQQVREARRQIAAALTMNFVLSLLFLLVIAAAWSWRAWGPDEAVYLIAFVGLAVNLTLSSAGSIWMALQEGYCMSIWELMQTVVTTVALLAATLYTRDVRVFVAIVYAGLVAANLGSLIHLWLRHPELRPERLPARWAAARDLLSSGMMFFLIALAGSLNYMLDNVLALQWLGPGASAQMAIALRICMTALGMIAVISQPLWPAFTDAAHAEDRPWVMHKLFWGAALLVGIAAVGALVLIVWGEPLLKLWLHTNLGMGEDLLVAISAWVLARALGRVPHLLLNGLLLVHYQTVVLVVALIVAFVLKFVLARSMGPAGILWGTTISVLLIVFPAFLWRIRRWARASKVQQSPA